MGVQTRQGELGQKFNPANWEAEGEPEPTWSALEVPNYVTLTSNTLPWNASLSGEVHCPKQGSYLSLHLSCGHMCHMIIGSSIPLGSWILVWWDVSSLPLPCNLTNPKPFITSPTFLKKYSPDSMHMRYPEEAKPWRQQLDYCLPKGGGREIGKD